MPKAAGHSVVCEEEIKKVVMEACWRTSGKTERDEEE